MPSPKAHFRSQRGATLIEVLVALGIGMMVVAVIVLAHHALTSETSRLSRAHKIAEQQEETLFTLREDLQQMFIPAGDSACGIELENSATNLVRLSFCRWLTSSDKSRLVTNQLEHVTYQFSSDTPPALLMLRRALTGPGAISGEITNRIANPWPRVLVFLHDGTDWQTNWVPAKIDEASPARPRAARIVLLGEPASPGQNSEPVLETVVIIPAGLSVTSMLLRASSIGP